MKTMQDIDLIELLPPNMQKDPTMIGVVGSLNDQMRDLSKRVDKISFYKRLQTGDITNAEADERAWMYRLSFYDTALPLSQKVELLKESTNFHRSKGTPSAIEKLVTILFGNGVVQEWWEYGGKPGYFQVTTNNPAVNQERAEEFVRAVKSVKRLSAHLERVVLSQSEGLSLYYASVVHVADFIKIR